MTILKRSGGPSGVVEAEVAAVCNCRPICNTQLVQPLPNFRVAYTFAQVRYVQTTLRATASKSTMLDLS